MNRYNDSQHIKSESDSAQDFGLSMNSFSNYGQNSWATGGRQDNFFSSGNSNNLIRPSFGSQQNLNTGFNDDELADFLDFDQGAPQTQPQRQQQSQRTNLQSQDTGGNRLASGEMSTYRPISTSHRTQGFFNDPYSNTPPGNPIQSPFARSFDHMQYANFGVQSQQSSMSFPNNMGNGSVGVRSHARTGSSSLSPTMPHSTSVGHPISKQKNRSSSSTHWEGGYGIAGSSLDDTPLSSPMSVPPMHHPLASIMENEPSAPQRHKASGLKAQSVPAGSTKEEQKKAKRRVAHNVVEQKRRDKINERIQELSRLVPAHRLEDNKIKRQLATSSRVGPGNGVNGMSPPTASSLRRTAGVATSLPDERDKTKGNSLDGAVAWTRDLMWMLHRKLEQEAVLIEYIEGMGGEVPFQINEDEQRMRSELITAMSASGAGQFEYSRTHGSGLWVPDHTDQAGQPLPSQETGELPMEFQANGNDSNMKPEDALFQYTPESGRDSLDFKEQDDFSMELN